MKKRFLYIIVFLMILQVIFSEEKESETIFIYHESVTENPIMIELNYDTIKELDKYKEDLIDKYDTDSSDFTNKLFTEFDINQFNNIVHLKIEEDKEKLLEDILFLEYKKELLKIYLDSPDQIKDNSIKNVLKSDLNTYTRSNKDITDEQILKNIYKNDKLKIFDAREKELKSELLNLKKLYQNKLIEFNRNELKNIQKIQSDVQAPAPFDTDQLHDSSKDLKIDLEEILAAENKLYFNNRKMNYSMFGTFDGKLFTKVPKFTKNEEDFYGESNNFNAVIQILISKDSDKMGGLGKVVREKYFNNKAFSDKIGRFKDESIIFKVHFSCGKPKTKGYINPKSHWYNVFYGFYEIVVSADSDLPYGYELDDENNMVLNPDELAAMFEIDWNYFSNYMYGVPDDYINPYLQYSDENFIIKNNENLDIGVKFDTIELNDIRVSSAYVKNKNDIERENRLTPLNRIWQLNYGKYSIKDHVGINRDSFFPVNMNGKAYVSNKRTSSKYPLEKKLFKNKDVYRTYIFGGSYCTYKNFLTPADKKKFLETQLSAINRIIEKDYTSLAK